MPFDIPNIRTETEEMIINAQNNGVPLPPTEQQDRVEQKIRQNGKATTTAATVELKDEVEPDLEKVRQFRSLGYRVTNVIAEVQRLSDEEVEEFAEKSDKLFEECRTRLNEIHAITTASGVNPKTGELRKQATSKSIWHGAGDGILSTGVIAGSGALEGGWLNAANYGLITPITATLLGYCAGDWLCPIAKEIRSKPLAGSLAWIGIVVMAVFVYVLVNQFADFRETLEAVPADYLSMALQAINLFAFFATLVVWAKAPPPAPKLKLLKKEVAERADQVVELYADGTDEIKDISDSALDDLEDLTEELEDDVDEVEIAFERIQDSNEIYEGDLSAARTDHERLIDDHRAQIRETMDAHATLPTYINSAADLSAVFVSGFNFKRYETLTHNASSALVTLDATIESAREDIDTIRLNSLGALKKQRQKDPTL